MREDVPILFVSGYDRDASLAGQRSEYDVLSKPFEIYELARYIHQKLHKH